jgi:hypothetical protein
VTLIIESRFWSSASSFRVKISSGPLGRRAIGPVYSIRYLFAYQSIRLMFSRFATLHLT